MLDAQRRLKSNWADAQTDKSSLPKGVLKPFFMYMLQLESRRDKFIHLCEFSSWFLVWCYAKVSARVRVRNREPTGVHKCV